MTPRVLSILGSTGSIGRSTLDVIDRHRDTFEIRALAAYSNAELLAEQYRRYRPKYLCLADTTALDQLTSDLADEPVEVLGGEDSLVELARLRGVDTVVNAVVGASGLRASLAAVEEGKALALANKESLVAGGPLFQPLLKKTGAKILPIDSEHSAIWQVLHCGKKEEIRHILLTASGGPFRNLPGEEFDKITVDQALDHPTWNMGAKITIDSATLANKGLEVIEAVQLFQIPVDKVQVVVHPQSIIHSMVEFIDASVIAQLSLPDMRLPITYALFWPERVESPYGRIDWSNMTNLTFEEPDMEKFPSLATAFEVARVGGTAPAAFNAANEVAVAAFLGHQITFTGVSEITREVVERTETITNPSFDDILDVDRQARETADRLAARVTS